MYSAGLFDYLEDKAFVHLARTLLSSLSEQGHLLIGNLRLGNPVDGSWSIAESGSLSTVLHSN